MSMKDHSLIKAGDVIKLNDKARAWTWDKMFVVDEVKSWGVVCHTQGHVEGIGLTESHYRAVWDEISNDK